MKKRILSLCMALALCLGLLPVTALAAAPNGQAIYVGEEDVTSGGYWTTDDSGNVAAYSGTGTPTDNYIHYDAADNTLTLHNATIKESVSADTSTLIAGTAIGVVNSSGAAELTIQLEGDNTIEDVSTGIYVLAHSSSTGDAGLTITGSGSLDASGSYNPGIRVQSNTGNGTLTITGAKVTASSSNGGNGVQIRCGEGSDASLTVNDGSLTATGSGNYSAGINLQFGSGDSGSGTPTVIVSENAIVKASSSNGGGIASNSGSVTPSGTGIVFNGNEGTVYGDVKLQEDLEIGEGERLTIGDGASLNTGSHEVIVNGGTLTDGDKITGTVKYAPTITTESLPNGTVGTAYSQTLAATGSDTITWSLADGSSLPAGLSLDENTGKIYGTPTTAEESTFTVTAANAYGSASREFTLTISAPTTIPVTGVSLDQNALTLTEGDTVQLTATVEPANATNKGVTWKSSDDEIAKVDNGVVTAVAPGTATITVTTEDGSKTATCAVTVKHGNMILTPQKDATCTAQGKLAYYTCETCGKYYEDEAGTREITNLDEYGIIAVISHSLTRTEAKAATCTEDGNTEYWVCETCGKYFSDADGETEIKLEDTVIPATDHSYGEPVWNWSEDGKSCTATFICANDGTHKATPEVTITSKVKTTASCTEKGVTEYTATAEFDGKTYTDTKEITDIPATGHSYENGKCTICDTIDPDFNVVITAGANGTWQKGTKDGLSFTSNADFADFVKVQVDGKDLDASNYTVKEGSTIVTLKAEYLETLSVGKHTLAVVSETGTAETEFTIKAAAVADDTQSPQTGDSSNIALWIVLLLISGGAGIVLSTGYVKRKKN